MLFSIFLLFIENNYAISNEDYDIHASVVTEYDDNITRDEKNEKDDFITNISVGIELNKEEKRNHLRLDGSITQQIYLKNTKFNNFGHDIELEFQRELTKYDTLSITDNYFNTEKPRNIEEEFGRTSGLYEAFGNNFDLTFIRETDTHRVIQIGYQNELYAVSGRDDINDSIVNGFFLEQRHEKNLNTSFFYRYDYLTRDFQDGSDATINTWSVGLRQLFNKRVTLDAGIGFSYIKSFTGETLSRPYVLISLTEEINPNSKLKLSILQNSTMSRSKEDIFDSWRVTGRFDHKFTGRLDIKTSAFYGQGEFNDLKITDDLFESNFKFKVLMHKMITA